MPAEDEIRASAMSWIAAASGDGSEPLRWDVLMNEFRIADQKIALVGQQGIRKPRGWAAPLSILTSAKTDKNRPYDDAIGADGYQRYKFRRGAAGDTENQSLRVAHRLGTPLVWFIGVNTGLYQPLFPVYVVDEEPAEQQFVMALTESQRLMYRRAVASPVETDLRRYLLRETKRRLHQPVFASRVMVAYGTRCPAPGLMEGLIQRKDEAHGRTEEVPGRDPGAGDEDGRRGQA